MENPGVTNGDLAELNVRANSTAAITLTALLGSAEMTFSTYCPQIG